MFKKYRNLNIYLSVVIGSLLITIISWGLAPLVGHTTTFLYFTLIITLNTWYGGLKLGLFITFFAILNSIYFFIFPYQFLSHQFFLHLYEISLFSLTGTLISFVIEKYKRTDLVNEHKQKYRQYDSQVKKLENENIKMKQEIKLRDEFLSIASHELKTPLTSMLLKLQLVLHNVRNVSLANFSVENLLKMLETAELQTKRLAKMINDLLNISLITTGKMNLELGKADVTEIVKEVVNEFSEKLTKSGYTLELEADKSYIGWVDKVRIEQVISNLMSNALKYGNNKPIEVKVIGNDSIAKIIVKDSGIGIEKREKDRIFGLFERGTTNNNYKGLGVGLFIANQIIKAHHGTIRVDSKPNSGATFTIEIPLKPPNKG